MFWTNKETPFQKALSVLGLLPKPLSPRRREVLRELEQLRRERPEPYRESRNSRSGWRSGSRRCTPPEEEHRQAKRIQKSVSAPAKPCDVSTRSHIFA